MFKKKNTIAGFMQKSRSLAPKLDIISEDLYESWARDTSKGTKCTNALQGFAEMLPAYNFNDLSSIDDSASFASSVPI